MLSAELIHRIPFFDVDSMEVAWHGHYVKYLELVRCELLEKINYNYTAMRESGFAWPIVDMRIKYIKPLRFNQDILLRATLSEWEYRILIKYEIGDVADTQRFTKAHTTQIAVDMSTQEMCYESPPILREKMLEAGLL